MDNLHSNTLATCCEETTYWKIPWCWERLKAGEEGDDRGWDSWMASLTQWTWVWASSRSWWWTGNPGCCSLWCCKELVRTEWLNSHPQIRTCNKLKLVTVKKQFNSDVLHSRHDLLLCFYTVQVSKVEEGRHLMLGIITLLENWAPGDLQALLLMGILVSVICI